MLNHVNFDVMYHHRLRIFFSIILIILFIVLYESIRSIIYIQSLVTLGNFNLMCFKSCDQLKSRTGNIKYTRQIK